MSCELIEGAYWRVRFAIRSGGRMPGREQWDELPQPVQARFFSLMKRFAVAGEILSEDEFRKLSGTDLCEFKRGQLRLFACMRPGEMLLLSFAKKQSRKAGRRDIEHAHRVCASDVGGH